MVHICNIIISDTFTGLAIGTGGAQPLNGALPSLPSPTMPGFNMAAQTANGQPPPQDAVYTNGIHQSFSGRKFLSSSKYYNGCILRFLLYSPRFFFIT